MARKRDKLKYSAIMAKNKPLTPLGQKYPAAIGVAKGSKNSQARLAFRFAAQGKSDEEYYDVLAETAKQPWVPFRAGHFFNTPMDSEVLKGTPPSVPAFPEMINYLMRGKLPGMDRAKKFLLDEHKFLDEKDLEQTVDNAMAELKPNYLSFANDVLTGKNVLDCYIKHVAGNKNPTKRQREQMRKDAHRLRKKPHVQEYISASLRLANMKALNELQYNETEWLMMQRKLINMAMGLEVTPKAFMHDGTVDEIKVRDAALGVAQRGLETIAKMQGWLSDKLELTGDVPMVMVKNFGGNGDEEPSGETYDAEEQEYEDAEYEEVDDEDDTVDSGRRVTLHNAFDDDTEEADDGWAD